jgi:xylulokinase
VLSPGQAFDSAGTASVFAVCVDSYRPDVTDKTIAVTPAVQRGHYIAFAFVNGGGLGLRWFRDELAEARYGFRELDALAAAVPPGSSGLLWFPHLQGRVLPPQPHARGAWIGLTSGHKLGHMYRALLEGIAYEYADWALRAAGPGTRLNEARALGGGSASSVWNQLKADVLGIDWVPLLRQECGVLGDAVIAAKATGHIKDLDVARDWQQVTEPIRPDPDRHRAYTRLLEAYRAMGPAIAPVFEKIDDLAEQA